MHSARLTGAGASGLKYDILTAMSVAGLQGTATQQVSMMRLVALVTARYNWRTDEFTIGQRDIAKMWGVNERTVKREIKRLTQSEVIQCVRPGVRGRVGAYRLNYERIAALSEPFWLSVGPDFDHRMRERYRINEPKVIPLRIVTSTESGGGPWSRIAQRLAEADQDIYNAWFSRLHFVTYKDGNLTLKSPGSFVSRYIETHLLATLSQAAEAEFGEIKEFRFEI